VDFRMTTSYQHAHCEAKSSSEFRVDWLDLPEPSPSAQGLGSMQMNSNGCAVETGSPSIYYIVQQCYYILRISQLDALSGWK
jgi:hypothetical protein